MTPCSAGQDFPTTHWKLFQLTSRHFILLPFLLPKSSSCHCISLHCHMLTTHGAGNPGAIFLREFLNLEIWIFTTQGKTVPCCHPNCQANIPMFPKYLCCKYLAQENTHIVSVTVNKSHKCNSQLAKQIIYPSGSAVRQGFSK